MDYLELAGEVTRKAKIKGADECDCFVEIGRELTIKVRKGEVESIERAAFRGLGLRFFINKCLGFGFTTDISSASLDNLIERSHAFALTSTPDPESGIAEFGEAEAADLEINDPSIDQTSLNQKTDLATACEQAAYDHDPRIKNIYGTSYSEQKGRIILARMNSEPIFYDATRFEMACAPVAEDAGEKRMGLWFSAERFLSDLEHPRQIGLKAAARAVSKLGATTVRTQKASVVFDPMSGSEIVREIFRSLDGERLNRGMSFLKGRIGEKVGSDLASFVDDGGIPRKVGSRPFDAEGIPTRRTLAIDRGTLRSCFYDFRSSRKAGVDPSGNARRGFASIPTVGENNFYLLPGRLSKDSVIGSVKNGVLILNLLGFGVNITTGDFSRGAEGLWIKDGKIGNPVDGITIAGNFLDILKGIEAVASDLHFFGRFGAPTFVVSEMTIAGE
jgi:PmbA protein